VDELLSSVLERAETPEPFFSGDEVRHWDPELRDSLDTLGLLRMAGNAPVVVCDACGEGHAEEVFCIESPPGSGIRAYIACPQVGRVPVPLARLERREIDFKKLAGHIATALKADGPVEEVSAGRIWLLGRVTLAGDYREVFLARGLTWTDAPLLVRQTPRLLSSSSPVVLSLALPSAAIWPDCSRPVLPLPRFLSAKLRRMVIARSRLEKELFSFKAVSYSVAPPQPRADGPAGGCWLWWSGRRHDVPKGNVYRLLDYMWDRDHAGYDDLVGPVFDASILPQTIRSLSGKANSVLKKVGIAWRLEPDSVTRHLTKQPAGEKKRGRT
jgi:hypothetical protein